MSMKIHAIQTGLVKVKRAQQIRKPGGLLRVLTDSNWTDWLPIYAWLIDHPEGLILVDTGETAKTADPGYFPGWHPYYRSSVKMNVRPEDEIDRQLNKIGVKARDIKTVILTHFHTDHAGGLHHFSSSNIFVSGPDYRLAQGLSGRLLGYLPHRWPKWFRPTPVAFNWQPFGAFDKTSRMTKVGDVIIVPTPGHTPGHISVVVDHEDVTYFLAGDTSYSEQILLNRQPDGVSPSASASLKTIDRILQLGGQRPVVYLPTHDSQSIHRLKGTKPMISSTQTDRHLRTREAYERSTS